MSTTIEGAHDAYLGAARQAFATGTSTVLTELGWWDLLADLDDDESRRAAFALFRAQGLELASSPALGGLVAQPYVEIMGMEPGSVVATIARTSPRRGPVHVTIGSGDATYLLVDRVGFGASVLHIDRLRVEPITVPGHMNLCEIHLDDKDWEPTVAEGEAAPARRRSLTLGRIGLACEMAGAAEGALALALAHARDREQFGQPIGSFQAVRHMLAWAMTDCAAIDSAATSAVAQHDELPPRFDEILKALAGRNARRVCERTLQVLGAIGFTAEHAHHHFHSRVLALDALLGTSADLTNKLGAWLREQGDSGLPGALLLPPS